jgi:hypothetical protein
MLERTIYWLVLAIIVIVLLVVLLRVADLA